MHMNYSQIMSPRPPLPRKVGVMTPSSYGSAAPAYLRHVLRGVYDCDSWPGTYDMYCVACMSCVVIFGLCTV